MHPTMEFMVYMLPQIFGWDDILAKRPKLQAWWAHCAADPVFEQV